MRDIESLILATGSALNFDTVSASTLRVRCRIRNPINVQLPFVLLIEESGEAASPPLGDLRRQVDLPARGCC
jgi:hypothetical protein